MSESLASGRLRDALAAAAQRLRNAGVDTPELDARLLLCYSAGLTQEALVASGAAPLSPEAAERLDSYLDRRLKGEPVSRILGFREFYGRSFQIDKNTLDPRPDSEALIDAALSEIDRHGWRDRPLRILDLGTGSGILLVTLLAELPRAIGVGLDLSLPALQMARENAEALGVGARAQFVASDWLEAIGGSFDVIVANPPYLAREEFQNLSLEVSAHDPHLALDGGEDGLDPYRRFASRAAAALQPFGVLLAEIGLSQAEAVSKIFAHSGLAIDESRGLRRDLAGRPRVVIAQNLFGPGAASESANVAVRKWGLESRADQARVSINELNILGHWR
jgi:release factor glutamine methyltransferase